MFSNEEHGEEVSPLEVRDVNVDLLQRKITDLQEDNKKLQEEATEVGREENIYIKLIKEGFEVFCADDLIVKSCSKR